MLLVQACLATVMTGHMCAFQPLAYTDAAPALVLCRHITFHPKCFRQVLMDAPAPAALNVRQHHHSATSISVSIDAVLQAAHAGESGCLRAACDMRPEWSAEKHVHLHRAGQSVVTLQVGCGLKGTWACDPWACDPWACLMASALGRSA